MLKQTLVSNSAKESIIEKLCHLLHTLTSRNPIWCLILVENDRHLPHYRIAETLIPRDIIGARLRACSAAIFFPSFGFRLVTSSHKRRVCVFLEERATEQAFDDIFYWLACWIRPVTGVQRNIKTCFWLYTITLNRLGIAARIRGLFFSLHWWGSGHPSSIGRFSRMRYIQRLALFSKQEHPVSKATI